MTNHRSIDLEVQTPVLETMVAGVPPVFEGLTRQIDKIVEQPLLGPKTDFPPATFTLAKKDASGRKRPQAIAHRGFKAQYPENTMGAFKGAVEIGADALETDIHMSKDGVIVLSHDKDLKRCFGRDEKIIDCTYDYLSTLRTKKAPHQSMPRLLDLLEYLAQPGLEEIWLLLDIKLDNDANTVMRLISETIQNATPSSSRPWHTRIVLGCWAAKYLPLCSRYLPGFPISHIGFSTLVASYFFKVPNVSFNLQQSVLMSPWGKKFIRKAQARQRPIFAWTVNEVSMMRWDIRHELDGVITDDPELYLQVRKDWHEGSKEQIRWTMLLNVLRMNIFSIIYGLLYRLVYLIKHDPRLGTRQRRPS